VSGDSGIGKTSLMQILFDPILGSHPVVLNDDFQSPKINNHDIRILVSPDDTDPTDFYNFTLIPNGEFLMKIKFR
jgi:uridine kinase